MAERTKSRGLIYLRRSSNRQELSLGGQLQWALDEAAKLGVEIDAAMADLVYMQAHRLSSYKSIRLDDAVTGADLSRPGFQALKKDALKDRHISHLFFNRRDRLARPEEASEMVRVENELRRAGVTLVLSGKIVKPTNRGEPDLGGDLAAYFEYYESGEFLRKLAERVITAQRQLARAGYRTGGNAPYGFVRILVDAHGNELEELSTLRRVRQAGCHVRIKPKDPEKIRTWLYILELKRQGWGGKRIAQHLNELGIPSPDAGRVRTDQGIRHRVSGKWNATTILDLCRNAAIRGLQEFGRRSEGAHRRLGAAGPRLLADADRTPEDKPKCVYNPAEVIITAETGAALYDVPSWQEIQQQMAERGKSQRGVSRVPDPGKYPLSCRVVDMTDNCGAIMYARTSGKRALYTCGRYMRTSGAECENNAVDAEALLRMTLATLQQLTNLGDRRDRLQQLLEERARGEASGATISAADQKIQLLTAKLDRLREEKETAGRRMAREQDDDRYQVIAQEFDRLKTDVVTAERELTKKQSMLAPSQAPESEVEAAMALLDDIRQATADGAAREQISQAVSRLGLRVGLTFTSAVKGKKRTVRKLTGGVMAFGDAELPVKLHGCDRLDSGQGGTNGSAAPGGPAEFEGNEMHGLEGLEKPATGTTAGSGALRARFRPPRGHFVHKGQSGRLAFV